MKTTMNAPHENVQAKVMSRHITVIGLGAMGGGIARHLLESSVSQTVTGYDRDVTLVKKFHDESLSIGKARVAPKLHQNDASVENSCKAPSSLDEAIFVDTDFVVLVLMNEMQCDEVCFGSNKLVPTLTPLAQSSDGKESSSSHCNNLASILPNDCCVICCTTVTADWAKLASKRFQSLTQKNNQRNISFVDCPVSGGPARARRGTLAVMPSSDDRSTITKAMPVLSAMAESSTAEGSIHVIEGGAGMGSMVKMVHQLLAGVHICAAAEALVLAAKAGLDVQQVYDIVNNAAGASWMFKDRGQRMIQSEESEVKSSLAIFVKDLDIVYNEAKRLHSPIPLANAALKQFKSGQSLGFGNKDDSEVVKVYEIITGSKVGRIVQPSIDDNGGNVGDKWIMEDGSAEEIVEVGCEPRHSVVLHNEYVRVLRVSFPPNDTTLAHRHSEDSVYFFLVEVDGGLNVVNHIKGMAPCCDCMDFGEVRYGTHKSEQPLVHKITNKSNQNLLCIDAEILRGPPVTSPIPLLADRHELLKSRDKCRVYKLCLEPQETVMVTYPFFHLAVTLRGGIIEYETGSCIRWVEEKKLSDVDWKTPVCNMKMTNVGLTPFEQFIAEWSGIQTLHFSTTDHNVKIRCWYRMDTPGTANRLSEKKKSGKKHVNNKAVQKRLAPLPTSKSRKRARNVTTLFHRYTQLKETATTEDEKNRIDSLIEGIGGQTAYQKASQVSTSYHSTSKWVLGCLSQNGWLYGIAIDLVNATGGEKNTANELYSPTEKSNESLHRRMERRDTRLLEIGAINTELLDAALALSQSGKRMAENEQHPSVKQKKYRLDVRAIDLHSMHDGIEEADFLSIPLLQADIVEGRYDVIVCSMVLNCVPTAVKRGAMLMRIVHFLRPGGLGYITIPKTCLNLSPYMDADRFTQLLQHVGLIVMEHTKDTPKVAFFVVQKSLEPPAGKSSNMDADAISGWRKTRKFREGPKFRNTFAIILPDDIQCKNVSDES